MAQTPNSYYTKQEDAHMPEEETTLSEQIRLGKLSMEISTALISEGTQQEMLTACTKALVYHLNAAFARIWILNEETNILELQASSGIYTHLDGAHARVPVGALKIGLIAAERTPHLTNTVIDDPRVGDQEWAKREGMIAFAGYPLLVEERLIGVMAIFARYPLNNAILQAMATVANGIALGSERLHMLEERTRLLLREQEARIEIEAINATLEVKVQQRTAVLNQLNAELQRSNQDLQEFAYVASHDLQEPLRKIQAFGNLLDEEYGHLLGDGRSYIERMRSAAARLRVLIDDLLTFSRVTTRATPFSQIDLAAVVQLVIDDLEPRIQMEEGHVEVGELPIIEADPGQMHQLFQNLIANALKFHRPNVPPVVKVFAEMQTLTGPMEVEEQHYRLFIADNGIGFDEKYLDRIFTVFQRLHGKSDYEGTGIGLAVVRKIVERHNGTITAKSTPGKGTTFIVTLPVIQKKLKEAVIL